MLLRSDDNFYKRVLRHELATSLLAWSQHELRHKYIQIASVSLPSGLGRGVSSWDCFEYRLCQLVAGRF